VDFFVCVVGGFTKIVLKMLSKIKMETNFFACFVLISVRFEHWLLYCE